MADKGQLGSRGEVKIMIRTTAKVTMAANLRKKNGFIKKSLRSLSTLNWFAFPNFSETGQEKGIVYKGSEAWSQNSAFN